MDDQLTPEQRMRLEALALAVEYTKKNEIYSGNSLSDGTVSIARRYAKYIREGK